MPPPPEGCSSWLLPQAKGQGEALPLGTAWADMLDPAAELAVVDLPVHPLAVLHAYHGEVPVHSHMVRTNGDGCVLFFEVDGNLYDHDGYLIADALGDECEQCLEPGVMEMISVPVPGFCDKYYIFVSRSGTDPVWDDAYPSRTQVAILDLSAQNYWHPTRKGALMDLGAGNNIPGLPGVVIPIDDNLGSPDASEFVGWLGYSYKMGSNAPMLRAIDPVGDGSRFWLYCVGTQAVVQYKIHATGIDLVYTGTLTDHYQPVRSSWASLPDKPYYRDATVTHTISTNQVVLAITDDDLQGWNSTDSWSPDHGPVLILRYDATTGALISTEEIAHGAGGLPDFGDAVDPGTPPPGPGLTGGPGGIAWIDYGTKLLIQGEAANELTNLWEYRVGIFDLVTYDWLDLTTTLGVQTPQNYIYARLSTSSTEGPQPAYYLPHANGLARIDDPVGAPAWTSSVAVSSDVTPPEFDGYPDDEFYHPRFINAQVTNDQAHLARVHAPACCETWSAYLGYQGYTFPPAPATVVWQADDNPFGNCNDVTFLTDLIVPPGITLIIHDMTMRFAVDAHFIVRAGAYAKVNYSLLTALDCPDNRWPGVRVEGDPDDELQQASEQGRFYMWHSEVRDAVVGVWCAREGEEDHTGGIVRTDHSAFTDCIVGARIERYHRIVSGEEQINLSAFATTAFTTTEDWPDETENLPKAHIHLYDVNGVRITSCSFTNTSVSPVMDPQHRGVGIVALDASFRCNGFQNYAQNRFARLTAGIVNLVNDPLFATVVDGMAFDRNLVGMYDMACVYSIVVNNRFTAMTSYVPLDYLTMGMYIDQSVGYVVERNYFEDIDLSGDQEVGSIGIWFHGPQPAENRIYDNEFHDLTIGNVADGVHHGDLGGAKPGLQWLCGLYEGQVFDQFLLYPHGTIKLEQGGLEPEATAGNVFEGEKDCNGPQFEPKVFSNHDEIHISYRYYKNDDSPDSRPECVEFPDNGPDITPTGARYDLLGIVGGQVFDAEIHCANGVLDRPDDGVVAHKSVFQAKQTQLNSAIQAYNGQMDNGEKETVLAAIEADPAWPSHQLRGFLLAHSPLSEEAILAAINRVQPMDPWHLSQVLVANSRLSVRIWAELDHTGALSPFFYNMVIEHGQDQSLREVLQAEVDERLVEKDLEQRLLVRSLLEDSTYVGKLDTLMVLYSRDTLGHGPQSAYQLALSHHRSTDVAAMDAVLAEDGLFDRLRSIGTLQETLDYDWANATSSDLEELEIIAFGGESLARGAAWGILYALGATDSLPNGVLPMELRSMGLGDAAPENSRTSALAAYPDPAQDRMMITCPDGSVGVLEIIDARGNTAFKASTAGHTGFFEVDVRSWAPGIYLARLVDVEGDVIGETKCAVVR